MKKIMLSCLSVAVMSATAHAQVSFAPELGLNISKYSIVLPGSIAPSSAVMGMRIGGIADVGISDKLSLQPGIFYTGNGVKITINSLFWGTTDLVMRISTVEVPVNLAYKFGKPGGNRLSIGAGPFMGLNIGGNTKVDILGASEKESLTIGSDSTDGIKALDFGAGLNVCYQLTSGLFFRARYQQGFAELHPATFAGFSMNSCSYGLSAGYFFGGKSKKSKTSSEDKK